MKAVSLFSGGLDSQLAVCLVKNQEIEVIGINFATPFFGANSCTYKAAEHLGIELHVVDIGEEYITSVLKNPVYGYGKNFNPCIDCHAFMLKKAGMFMHEIGASFLISGEVVGQRPMSQNKSALNAVDKLSGFKGLIVRPLSAKLLTPTIPEEKGWIDRNKLMDISGRSRKRQMEMAEEYGITEYPSPAGGCLLTEKKFASRLERILAVQSKPQPKEMELLKLGRHFYLAENILLIVGRKHAENIKLEKLALPEDYLLKVTDRPGPLGLLRTWNSNEPIEAFLEYASAIVARYSDARSEPTASVKVCRSAGDLRKILTVEPASPDEVPAGL